MRLIKMFGLAALAAVAAMAFVGASSAMAEYTDVCEVHEEPCPNGKKITLDVFHLLEKTIGLLEGRGGSGTDLLCLKVLSHVHYGELAAPLAVTILTLEFAECGTEGSGGGHSNCATVTALHLPYDATLLKTELNLGELEILYGLLKLPDEKVHTLEPTTLVKCTIFGFIKVECEFGGGGLSFHVHGAGGGENGKLLAEGVLPKIAGGSLCPEESEITTATLVPLKPTYLIL